MTRQPSRLTADWLRADRMSPLTRGRYQPPQRLLPWAVALLAAPAPARLQDLWTQPLLGRIDHAEIGAGVQLGRGEQEIHHRGEPAGRGQVRPGVGQTAQLPEQVRTLPRTAPG